ncbi:MAG: hypothetical protein CMI16_11285 [Opitutaceae bacterium]|nr:hypothetical protein [Opitutaceae bacterium]
MHDSGDASALRHCDIGDKHITNLREVELGGGGSLAGGHDDFLTSGGDRLTLIVEEGDLHLALTGDEELGTRIGAVEHASAIGADAFLGCVFF